MRLEYYFTMAALTALTAGIVSAGCENKYQQQLKIYQDSLKIVKKENAQLKKENAQLEKTKEGLLFLLSCFVEQDKVMKELEELEKSGEKNFSKKNKKNY